MLRKLSILICLSFLFSACSKHQQSPEIQNLSNNQKELLINTMPNGVLRVVDTNLRAIANAKVLIGKGLEDPFRGNYLTTNAKGEVIIPQEWLSPQHITIEAAGYIRTTYLEQNPQKNIFMIRKAQSPERKEVSGITNGYGRLPVDNIVDFGLILPLANKSTFFQFDLNLFISPEYDTIEVMGQRVDIPSNISLPDQRERYMIFTVRLNKPQYRSYFYEPGRYELVATHGRFPFRQVVDELRGGKNFTDLVNLLDFVGAGIRSVDVFSPRQNTDIPINEIIFSRGLEVQAPQVPNGFSYFVAGLNYKDGLLYPSDIKRLNSFEKMNIKLNPNANIHYSLSAIAKEVKGVNDVSLLDPAMSISIVPAIRNIAPKHLPISKAPEISNQRIHLDIPDSNDTFALGTYVSIQDVKFRPEAIYAEEPQKVWEFFSDQWISHFDLPNMPDDLVLNHSARIESIFLASSTPIEKVSGPQMFEMAEYVSRNATDY